MLRAACLLSRGRGLAAAPRVWVRASTAILRVAGPGDVKGGRCRWVVPVDAQGVQARRGVPDLDEGRHRRAVGASRVVFPGAGEAWDRLALAGAAPAGGGKWGVL